MKYSSRSLFDILYEYDGNPSAQDAIIQDLSHHPVIAALLRRDPSENVPSKTRARAPPRPLKPALATAGITGLVTAPVVSSEVDGLIVASGVFVTFVLSYFFGDVVSHPSADAQARYLQHVVSQYRSRWRDLP